MTTTITADVAPTPVQLWALAYLLRANWRDAVTTRSSFETNITAARSTAEQRFGLRAIPFRTSSVLLSAAGRTEVQKLRLFMQRAGQSHFLFPLYSDVTQATTTLTTTQTVLSCDTTCRRFSVGRRVVVCAPTADAAPTFETGIISAISDTTITLSAGLANAYDIHATIMPLMEANLVLNSSGGVVTSEYAHATFTAVEASSGLQLANAAEVGSTPDGYPTYNDVPIFDTEPNYAEDITFNIVRSGSAMDSGIDSLPAVFGSRAAYGFKANYPTYDRASLWKLLKFFESRGGMLLSFFGISPTVEFTATAVGSGGSSITVQANTLEYDWAYTGYIAVRQVDGTVDVRKVASVVRITNSDTVTFDSPITGLVLANVQRVHHAFYARFDQDELAESWANNVVQDTTLSIKELIEEKDVTIADLVKIVTSDLRTVWLPLICEGLVYLRRAWDCTTGLPYGDATTFEGAVWLTTDDAGEIGEQVFYFADTDCLYINFAEDPIPILGISPTPVARSLDDIVEYYPTCAECLVAHPDAPGPGDPTPCDLSCPDTEEYNVAINMTVERFDSVSDCSGAADCTVTSTINYTFIKEIGDGCPYHLDTQTNTPDSSCSNLILRPIVDAGISYVNSAPCGWALLVHTPGLPATFTLVKLVGTDPTGSYTGGPFCIDLLDGTSIRVTINSAVVS